METILVVEGNPERRDALVRAVSALRSGARVLPAASWAEALGRVSQERPAAPLVALTADVSPDTLMGAEAFGVFAILRTPPELHQLENVLRFLDDRGGVWS